MSDEKNPLKTKQAAKRKVMDLIARRDHSEKELRKKLREKFSDEEDGMEAVEEAIAYAKDNNWLGDPVNLAHRLADMLHRRNKGIYYINNYLKEKGLPAVETDRALELEKALAIVKNKYDEDYDFTREDKARVGRLLASRGFDSETVRKVLYEKL
ncbi:regulatory protein RecX [Bdellovibrio svalbardensis]|uniref:Regulatory protein RecX n=1 Tax=Bdellovibrio svalbardensis TaxID=2972972 RepID=A0ABT6DJK9_9BACT|nr:regulatory protein RecX [Bdellovibrio svalbardensis]MDG0817046.1 recombination regulator RecX [Bdellovibrio svalbardensis]